MCHIATIAAANLTADSMDSKAKQLLNDLAVWFKTAETERTLPNMLKCVDKGESKKMEDFMKHMDIFKNVLTLPSYIEYLSDINLSRITGTICAGSPEKKKLREMTVLITFSFRYRLR